MKRKNHREHSGRTPLKLELGNVSGDGINAIENELLGKKRNQKRGGYERTRKR